MCAVWERATATNRKRAAPKANLTVTGTKTSRRGQQQEVEVDELLELLAKSNDDESESSDNESESSDEDDDGNDGNDDDSDDQDDHAFIVGGKRRLPMEERESLGMDIVTNEELRVAM
jgi:DNA-directed RNA polymerase specialized sigma subunit